jgi:hypothetical protein
LTAANARGFVRFGVGAQTEAVLLRVIGYTAEVVLHHVQIDEEGGGIDVGYPHHFS